MKPYKRTLEALKEIRPSSAKKTKKKIWELEYKWIDKKSYHTYPGVWGNRDKEYTDEWTPLGWFSRFITPEGAQDSLKKDLRSTFMSKFVEGRYWRVVNMDTGEKVEFPDILNFYK